MPYTETGVGYRPTDTSRAAADAIAPKVKPLREQVLDEIKASARPIGADEIAAMLGRPYGSVRPRCTELQKDGLIEDSGQRGKSLWGKTCILWRAA